MAIAAIVLSDVLEANKESSTTTKPLSNLRNLRSIKVSVLGSELLTVLSTEPKIVKS